MEITFRSIRKSDSGFHKEMFFESLYVHPGETPLKKDVIDRPFLKKYWIDFGNQQLDTGIIAEDDGRSIGAVWGRTFTESEKGYGFVSEDIPELGIALVKGYRGFGVGSQLISLLEEKYKSLGVQSISLSVDPRNAAKKLYERLGYVLYESVDGSETMLKQLS